MIKSFLFSALMLLIAAAPLFSQNAVYDPLWKTTDSLIEADLPQSALAEVDKIYTQAKSDKNNAQIIKAVIYRISLIADYQEDYYETSIADMKKEI